MQSETREATGAQYGVVYATGEELVFRPGDQVRVLTRTPVGHYRVAFPMSEIWAGYAGSPRDALYIEVYETWLERM